MILVSYTRDGDLLTGSVGNIHFDGITIDKLVGVLHSVVSSVEDREVTWEKGGVQQRMPPEDVDLLLSDPVALIRKMNPPPVRIDLRTKKSTLVIGHDTLANGFGENVYVRRKGATIECPCCGAWTSAPACRYCEFSHTEVTAHNDKWSSVPTEVLIATGREQFFLPRAWNKGKPWISRKELESKYQSFLKERSHV